MQAASRWRWSRATGDGARQWSRHSGGPASEVQDKSCVGGDPHHAAFGRKVRRQGLCDLRRPARRRQFGGQCAVRSMEVEVARDRVLWKQSYARGKPTGKLINAGSVIIAAAPDALQAGPEGVRRARVQSGAAVSHVPLEGLSVPRRGNPLGLRSVPAEGRQGRDAGRGGAAFPRRARRLSGGRRSASARRCCRSPWPARPTSAGAEAAAGRLEWAIAWLADGEGFLNSYCNTMPTTEGGTHEAGFRAALLKGLRAYGEQSGNRRAAQVTAEDLLGPMRRSSRCSCASRNSRARPRRSSPTPRRRAWSRRR